jgi:hypothetical protein
VEEELLGAPASRPLLIQGWQREYFLHIDEDIL